jgi:hypothetical protein
MFTAPAPAINPALGLTADRNALGVLSWVRALDDHKVRLVAGITAAPNGYACYLSPPCPLWMGCDCPPHAPLSMAPRR